MELYIEKQLQTVLCSFILGLIFGGLYDIIRIIHILCGIASYSGNCVMKRGKIPFVLFFVFDIVYALVTTAVFSVFQYWRMNGQFRLFVLVFAVIGFVVWHCTVGRGVMMLSETVANFVRVLFRKFIVLPIRFVLKFLRKSGRFLYRHTAGLVINRVVGAYRWVRSNRIRKMLERDIRFSPEK